MKKLIIFIIILSTVFILTSSVWAKEQVLDFPRPKGVVETSLPEVLGKIINLALYLVGGVAVLFLIIGGFQFIMAAGNPQGAQTAKNTVLYVIIGLVIVLLSNVAVQFIIQKLAS